MSASEQPQSAGKSPPQSWLLWLSRNATWFWRYQLAIWGFLWFYQPEGTPPRYNHSSVRRKLWLADTVWFLTCLGSIVLWVYGVWSLRDTKVSDSIFEALHVPKWVLYVCLAAILWRVFDAFVNAADVSPFGYGAVRQEIRGREINQRLVLLNIMTLIELIFLNATLSFGLERIGVAQYSAPFVNEATSVSHGMIRALQTSFSTITTIGYGTYAPENGCAIALAILQSLTGLLLVSLVAAGAISLAVTPSEKPKGNDATSSIPTAPERWHENWEKAQTRWWLPILATMLVIGGLVAVVQSIESANRRDHKPSQAPNEFCATK
jgi:hypothetical protein